jgi:hypothetical protein
MKISDAVLLLNYGISRHQRRIDAIRQNFFLVIKPTAICDESSSGSVTISVQVQHQDGAVDADGVGTSRGCV